MFWRLTIWVSLALAGTGCSVQPLTPTPASLAAGATPATATLLPMSVDLTATAVPPSPTISAPATSAAEGPPATLEVAVQLDSPTEVPAAGGAELAGVAAEAQPTHTPEPTVSLAAPPSADVAAAEQYCIDWINSERAAAGVTPLARDEVLMGIARARVADMIARGYTGHADPVTGEALGQAMMRAAGYASSYVGENWFGTINGPPTIVDAAMTWFMTDPPHSRNILSPNFAGVGVGIGFNGQLWLLVQNFAGQ